MSERGKRIDRVYDFNHHLDVCKRCRDNPFDLCIVGVKLLNAVVGSAPAGEP